MKEFLIFVLLITSIGNPIHSLSKNKAAEGCGSIFTDTGHKHASGGGPNFKMELILNSPKYGQFIALYDDEDHEIVSKHIWRPSVKQGKCYVSSYNSGKTIYIHNVIMGHLWIDHVSGDPLDNRKINLRKATCQENTRNQGPKKHSITGFKCVFPLYKKGTLFYTVEVRVRDKKIQGGYFKNKYLAVIRANELMQIHHGEFAKLNILTQEQLELSKQVFQNRLSSKNTTGYRGVLFSNKLGKYVSYIYLEGRSKHLGLFRSPVEAAMAYNEAVVKYGRPKKYLNIIPS